MTVSVEEALALIYDNVTPKSTELLPLEMTGGRILAENITASYNLPPFDNSAMDGYAVKTADEGQCVNVLHTIFAGDKDDSMIFEGSCSRIMTGAKIPEGTECIVPIEDILECDDGVVLPDVLKTGQHIRLCGEDIKSEDLLLSAGEKLFAHHIGLLASQGISHVKVFKRPRVALFASGSELKMHFENIGAHQLYNTNTPTFTARAEELGCEVSFIGTAEDSLDAIHRHIESALDSDLIITSGGVSVGDADYTKEAFGAFGFEILFDKINIKPGKPTTFGKVGETSVLNLPGNPLAAALNFEIFGQSIILALSGSHDKYLGSITAEINEDYPVKRGRRTLIPGFYDGRFFKPSDKFAPGMVSPLAKANGFVMLDEAVEKLKKGTIVKVIPTRFSLNQKKSCLLVTS